MQGLSGTSDFRNPEDSSGPGLADWPAMGGLPNDMGAFGGQWSVFMGPDPAQIFADDFESADLAPWSSGG